MLLYSVFFFLLFGRIDSVFTTVEIGVCECSPDSFRDCPSATVTCPLSFCGLILASTLELKVRHLTRHRKETSNYLLSPLLYIYELYMVAAYLTIPTSTTLKTVTATNNLQGYLRVARPIQEATVRAIA